MDNIPNIIVSISDPSLCYIDTLNCICQDLRGCGTRQIFKLKMDNGQVDNYFILTNIKFSRKV